MSNLSAMPEITLDYLKTMLIECLELEGDVVECGVYKGGSAIHILDTLKENNKTYKYIWLYDTYEGLPKPTKWDKKHHTNHKTSWREDWYKGTLEEVKTNISTAGYGFDNIKFIPGLIEDTILKNQPDKISFLHLDMDFYSPTKVALEHLYPKLSDNGILVIDDYGSWKGVRKAVNDYFGTEKPDFLPPVHHYQRALIKKPQTQNTH